MRATNIKQTCFGCPSQWEANLDDGRMIYVRYRWGHLSVNISPKETRDVFDAVRGDLVFSGTFGGGLDGDMTTDEMMDRTADVINWSEVRALV